jgi:hypothetical protein
MSKGLGHKFLIIQIVLLLAVFILAIGISFLTYLLINNYKINNNLPRQNSNNINLDNKK